MIYMFSMHNENIPRKAGVFPVLIPTSCYGCDIERESIDSGKTTYMRCTTDGQHWYMTARLDWKANLGRAITASSQHHLQCKAQIDQHYDHRWDKSKPVANTFILRCKGKENFASSVTVRTLFDDGTYVDFESSNLYFVNKCREELSAELRMYEYGHLASAWQSDTGRMDPVIAAQFAELLHTDAASIYDNATQQISWSAIRTRLSYPNCGDDVDFQALVDNYFQKRLPKCSAHKPFLYPAPYKAKIRDVICCLSNDQRNGTACIQSWLSKVPQYTQQSLYDDIIYSVANIDGCARDSYGNHILCIGLQEVKEVDKPLVLKRFEAQDARQ